MNETQKRTMIIIISIAIGISSIIVANLFNVYQLERTNNFGNSVIFLSLYFYIPIAMLGISIAIIVSIIKQLKNEKQNTRTNNMCH